MARLAGGVSALHPISNHGIQLQYLLHVLTASCMDGNIYSVKKNAGLVLPVASFVSSASFAQRVPSIVDSII